MPVVMHVVQFLGWAALTSSVGHYHWVPSHVGNPSNERADQKAKHGAESSQTEVPLTLRRARALHPHTLTNVLPAPKKPRALESHWKPWPVWFLFQDTWCEPKLLSTFA
ncbi:hypothetical protein TNCV_4908351 [Trichonephila clavipes]|uniref:RNase H type-1 domain-containing protein n=1 Tax=Trichonephila clavipes TaxID=2585209 RepID=A0A8X6V7X2_TRICX|nr:hypothetical protein TNCV_4908351 [Trichonephila clavipes]